MGKPRSTASAQGAPQQVTREDLYEQVWREPMLRVAERHGVSSSLVMSQDGLNARCVGNLLESCRSRNKVDRQYTTQSAFQRALMRGAVTPGSLEQHEDTRLLQRAARQT